MPQKTIPHMADVSKPVNAVQRSHKSSTDDTSPMEDPAMHRFAAVLAQLKHENVASLVSSIRQADMSLHHEMSSQSTVNTVIGCKVLPKPLYGSYHLAYRVSFDDGMEWILKVPANGHHACFDRLAAEALTSEALTMRMIKQRTTIPVPTVHHFHASPDNDIGCPYILMDFLKGKPVWQGWFDEEASPSKLEQFRARSLQTIAAAMVQLNQFAVHRGGSLRFNSDGEPVDVAGARVPDWLAEHDVMQGLIPLAEGCPYCEKGPISEPASSLLFMLDRRGIREKDQAYDRGVHKALRLFTEWILEKAENTDENGPNFVLSHPDFALQNFLVEDDGTLCGVIDFDGVAAVPHSVGCLRYPDWLMSDWHPWYSYKPGESGQRENSPEELATYRNMYAQFVEVFSSLSCRSIKAGKSNADITRMSLIAGSLGLAAEDLKLTDDMVDIIFEKLMALAAEDDDSDVSDTESESSDSTSTEYDEEEDGGSETAPAKLENSSPCFEEESGPQWLCFRCIAELAPIQDSTSNVDEEPNEMDFSAAGATSSGKIELRQEHNGVFSHSDICTEEAVGGIEAIGTRETLVARCAMDLDGKAWGGVSKGLNDETLLKSQTTRKVKVAKWALDLCSKGCRRASKAFHKKEEASILQPKSLSEAVPARIVPRLSSKALGVAMCLCDRSETLLRKIILRLHRHSTSRNDGFIPKGTKIRRVQNIWKRLVGLLRKTIWNSRGNEVHDVQMPSVAEAPSAEVPAAENPSAKDQSATEAVLVDTEHCQRCNPVVEAPGQENRDKGSLATKTDSEDVWAEIAADVEQGGIPIDLIKKRRDVIAKFLIQNLQQEMEPGKKKKPLLKNQKKTGKAKKARAKAGVTNANYGNSKLDTTQQSPFISSENITCPKSLLIASTDSTPDAVNPDYCGSHDEDRESSEPESLILRLQAAKQRFDLEMAQKRHNPRSMRPEFSNAHPEIVQHGNTEQQTSVYGFTNLEDIEEGNRKLRMLLSSFAKPNAADPYSEPNVPQALERNGLASEGMEPGNSHTSGRHTESSAALEIANEKLRAVLASFRNPEAAVTNLQHNILHTADGEDRVPKNEQGFLMSSCKLGSDVCSDVVAAQPHKAVQGGRWFETPRGSLKRLEDDGELSGSLGSQNSISPPGSCFSIINEGSSKTSGANSEYDGSENGSGVPLKFPNPNQSGGVRVFEIPANEEDDEDSQNNEEGDELEDGEIVQEARSSVDDDIHGEGDEISGREVGTTHATNESKTGEIIDSGYFAMGEVCVALGNGNLDERRMTRLKDGFMALLDNAIGLY